MPSYNLTNGEGLFYPFYTNPIMAEETAKLIRNEYLPSVANVDERNALEDALRLVEALPIMETRIWMTAKGKSQPVNIVKKTYAWLSLGPPESQSPAHPFPASSAKEAGWLDIGLVEKRYGLINQMLSAIGQPSINPNSLIGAGGIKKRSATVVFSEISEFASLGESSSVAVFMTPNAHLEQSRPGFLDAKGNLGPLSRARLFESPKAAERSLRMSTWTRLSTWKAVEISLATTKALDLPGDASSDQICQAIAQQEKKALDRALGEASLETLRARVKELEAEAGIEQLAPRKAGRL